MFNFLWLGVHFVELLFWTLSPGKISVAPCGEHWVGWKFFQLVKLNFLRTIKPHDFWTKSMTTKSTIHVNLANVNRHCSYWTCLGCILMKFPLDSPTVNDSFEHGFFFFRTIIGYFKIRIYSAIVRYCEDHFHNWEESTKQNHGRIFALNKKIY